MLPSKFSYGQICILDKQPNLFFGQTEIIVDLANRVLGKKFTKNK